MDEMAYHISGTGSAPIDMSTLIATDFIGCKILDFHLKATCLHDLVGSNPKALSIYEIIQTLKTKLRSLKAQGPWIPSEGNKLDTKGELTGINLAMNKLVELQKRGQTNGNGLS